ncbi:MAG: hypothetical protein AAGC93_08045 [Cyanobacteria bacterium P01_F01_bin.53]
MKRLTLAGLFFFVWAIAPSSFAQTITSAQPNSQTSVALYRGQGLTLNFRPTGETIQKAWLDDPSQTTLDFDDANCSAADTDQVCAASVIHLRRINPIDFPGLPSTDVTNLTVLTNNNLYSFRLTFPDTGSPSYTVLNIESEQAPETRTPGLNPPVNPRLTRAEGIEAIEQGLEVARARNLINEGDPLWQRTQTFLSLIGEGMSAETAANQAGVSQSLMIRLSELGQTSPTLAI